MDEKQALIVTIKNGLIINHNGSDVKVQTPISLMADEWSITITPTGKVIGKKSQVAKNGIAVRVKLDISASGKGVVSFTRGKNRATILKRVVADNPHLMTLTLSTQPLEGGVNNARKQVSVR